MLLTIIHLIAVSAN